MRLVVAAAILVALQGCGGDGGTGGPGAPAPTAEALLIGGGKCRSAGECASGACSVGRCIGYLAAATEQARDAIAPRVEAAAGDAVAAAGLVALATSILADRDGDRFVRARAADVLRRLPPATGLAVLPSLLDDPDEPMRFFAARALHALGDRRGTEALKPFLHHSSEAVRRLAEEALAVRGPRSEV
jgi:hypothetical protein